MGKKKLLVSSFAVIVLIFDASCFSYAANKGLNTTNHHIETICHNIIKRDGVVANKQELAPKDEFVKANYGLYKKLTESNKVHKYITGDDVAEAFGVNNAKKAKHPVKYKVIKDSVIEGLRCSEGVFYSYDAVKIPYYEIFPDEFDKKKSYPTVILFSGHGNMDQVAFAKESYQKGLGIYLAKHGFVVFVMENRGMGKLSYLGDHMRIDAVARMVGGSWYGEITTDALYLLDMVVNRSYTNKIGVGGVSTGGALSLLTSSIDKRISATYVQGYLGSYKTTFGSRANHHECNNISNIINKFDLSDIGISIYPRSAMYVNGKQDGFYASDAKQAFTIIKNRYILGGHPDNVKFCSPENTSHEMSNDIALSYFKSALLS